MDRSQLTLMIASALFLAIALGWALRWIYGFLNPPPPPEPLADSEWAVYAKACEDQRDAATARLEEVERDLNNRLAQTQAELTAAMETLGTMRREAREQQMRSDEATSA